MTTRRRQIICACCGKPGLNRGYGWIAPCYLRWLKAGRPAAGPPPPADPTVPVYKRCVSCDREMVGSRAWAAHPELREGRTRAGSSSECMSCYMRDYKQRRKDEAAEQGPPEKVRVAVEQLIACGWPTSRIMAELDVSYEDVAAVRERQDRLAAAS